MHFHLPKPVHGWRAFAGEVGIIVVGVLIALGAEQVVEAVHWQEQVRAGRSALRQDYADIVTNAREREAEDICIRRRLLYLRDLLNSHPDRLPAIGDIGSPPVRPWYPASWDSLVASNVSAHMTRNDLLMFGAIATQARLAEDTAQREIEDWSIIYTMVGPARPLAPGEAAQLRKAITDAAYQLNLIRLAAPQVSQKIAATKLLGRGDLAQVDRDVAATLHGPNARHICGPILSMDASRVDAPYDPAIEMNPVSPNEHENR
jgi:hypothetical protein